MKKIIFLIGIVGALNLSCEREQDEINPDAELLTEEQVAASTVKINNYNSWKEFHDAYDKYGGMDQEELEAVSFYKIEEENSQYSPALQAITNKNNQFKINGELIELQGENFVKVNTQKSSIEKSEIVGTVSFAPMSSDNKLNQKVTNINHNNKAVYNLKEFRQQRYVDCLTGSVHGPAPRNMRYLHQVFGEYIVTGTFRSYSLFLRLYLEYNHRRRSWRLSGEKRDITVNLTDRSRLFNSSNEIVFLDESGNPFNYKISYTSPICESHKIFRLRLHRAFGSLPIAPIWRIDLKGTITQKMHGDAEENRWTDHVSW